MRSLPFAFASLLLSAPAFGADLGTYRPGTPYHSTAVPAADICESTCAGDAKCQGWNYVKAAPQAPGICELQSSVGAPVSSAISISGVNIGQTPTARNVVSGGTNTVRVGTSAQPKPAPQAQRAPSGRRIVRQAMPAQQASQPTAYRQPTQMPARVSAPQFRPMLDGRAIAAQRGMMPAQGAPQMPVQARGPARQRGVMRTPQPQPQMQRQMPRQATGQMMPQQMTAPLVRQSQPINPRLQPRMTMAAPQSRPPIGQPIPPMPAQPATPLQSQVQTQAGVPAASGPLPTRSAAQPLTMKQAPRSLYGSLQDDVRAPAANAPVPADPSAPIPTAQARPVAPVSVEPLAGPIPR